MDMLRVTTRWTGFHGAPGYSNFFFAGGGGLISDAQQVADRVMSAFNELRANLAPDVQINLESEAAIIDSDSGMVQGYQPVSASPVTQAGTTSTYAGPVGGVVNWRTNDLRNGRRIRGRTFIVPLASSQYDSDGSLGAGAMSSLRDFAGTLVGGDIDSELGVWSRPVNGSGGVFATVTGYSVPDLAAVLRSRRD